MNQVYGLFGAGGQGREVAPLLKRSYPDSPVYLVDIHPPFKPVEGLSVLTESQFSQLEAQTKYFNVAIADPKIRKRIVSQCLQSGYKPFTLLSDDLRQYHGNTIGEGAMIGDRTMITCDVQIGRFFLCNYYSYIAHDCKIGDFVTFLPNVSCSGHVHIGNGVIVGAGAMIKNGSPSKPIIIGDGAYIGMGAVVTKDVAANTVVVGNPARILEK